MFCRNCGRYFSGLVNRARHILARDGKKYGYDCRNLQEVPIAEAKQWLDSEWRTIKGKKVTYKEMLLLSRPKPLIKFNKRNHGEKSTGSDKRRDDMKYKKMGGRHR